MKTEFILSINKVSKRYGVITALDSVSFTVEPGQSLALWGANGAGKTTLIKAILGMIRFQGEIHIAGKDAWRDGKAARRSIGYVPQEAVHYDMSGIASLAFYARIKRVPLSNLTRLVDRLGLSEHLKKPVPALSGGLKQRLALAIAMLSDPPILLLDEPTANLDAQGRVDYLALLAELRREGKTILFASHRIEEVEALADRVVLMENGKIIDDQPPAQLRLRLAPLVEMTFWIDEAQRALSLKVLQEEWQNAHLNGRGTVVVQVAAEDKLGPLNRLAEQGIQVRDFEMEKVQPWN
jgi:ABC-type multidrug transport system ATPase subunit